MVDLIARGIASQSDCLTVCTDDNKHCCHRPYVYVCLCYLSASQTTGSGSITSPRPRGERCR